MARSRSATRRLRLEPPDRHRRTLAISRAPPCWSTSPHSPLLKPGGMGLVRRREQSQCVLVLLVVHLAADEFGSFGKRDGSGLLRHLTGNEQETSPVVGTNDPQPAATLGFVQVRQLSLSESLLVLGQPGEHELSQFSHAAATSSFTHVARSPLDRCLPRC